MGSPTDSALKGRKPKVETAKRHALIEVKAQLGYKVILALWDIQKFFDSLDIELLIERSQELNFPPTVLALALEVHKGTRHLSAAGTTAKPIGDTGSSILAGCTNSTSFSRAYIRKITRGLADGAKKGTSAEHILFEHVDDLA